MSVSEQETYDDRSRRAAYDRAIAICAAGAPWHVPFWKAARDGVLCMNILHRGARCRRALLGYQERPTIAMIDDDDHASSGPAGFAGALPAVQQWPHFIAVHATGGDVRFTLMLITLAVVHRRLLIIETDSAHAAEWRAWADATLPGRGRLVIMPPAGQVHPIRPAVVH